MARSSLKIGNEGEFNQKGVGYTQRAFSRSVNFSAGPSNLLRPNSASYAARLHEMQFGAAAGEEIPLLVDEGQ